MIIPHIVIMNLSRGKLDANRTLKRAVEKKDPIATNAWYHWHNFINLAKYESLKKFNSCKFFF